jgi:hypothetical protein
MRLSRGICDARLTDGTLDSPESTQAQGQLHRDADCVYGIVQPFPLGYAERTQPYPLWIRKLVPCLSFRLCGRRCKVDCNTPGGVCCLRPFAGAYRGMGPGPLTTIRPYPFGV